MGHEEQGGRQRRDRRLTLGDLLSSKSPTPSTPEREWIALVQAIAKRDPRALHALYSRMHQMVFTFMAKVTKSRETAEQLTLKVFHEIWRRPSVFNPVGGSVIGWIMNLARSRAIDRLWIERRRRGVEPAPAPVEPTNSGDLTGAAAPHWDRLAKRIAEETGREVLSDPAGVVAPEWEDAAPGLAYKILARDLENERVSMLVRLAPGAAYPPHIHVGVEELYLLDGELFIEDRKLYPGAYNRAEAGTGDQRVWSETGCTCVLLTSTGDVLR